MSIKRMSAVWDQSQQKGSALLLLLAIADYADDIGVAWPAYETLAQKTRMSRRHVIRLIQECETSGELWVLPRTQTSNVYIVTVSLSMEDLRAAALKAQSLRVKTPTGSDILSPPPQVLAVVTKCHPKSPEGDNLTPDSDNLSPASDTDVTRGVTPMSPDPSLNHHDPPMKQDDKTTWLAILNDLQLQMASATFDTNLRGSVPIARHNGTLTIQLRHAYAVTWVENRLAAIIERTVERHAPGLSIAFVGPGEKHQ